MTDSNPLETHHCKRCGDRIPATSPDGINVVYLGTVGARSPDVPDDLEGLCLPCLSDDGMSAERSVERLNRTARALAEAGQPLIELQQDVAESMPENFDDER